MSTPEPTPPIQWTVGQLRAELVGLPDDTPLVIDVVQDGPAGSTRTRLPLIGAGYGQGVDPDDPIFSGQEYPLTAGQRTVGGRGSVGGGPRVDLSWPDRQKFDDE
ncbi:DUF6225 family protein [Actinotalea sp. C106]|uniref:DUF6225 family protein n=1 Tax=Actinotalea sp. C106 TaxID=2908644 RepID=UPI0020289834|nr:DUF6225 family protein [Actinotalea sp. C106]